MTPHTEHANTERRAAQPMARRLQPAARGCAAPRQQPAARGRQLAAQRLQLAARKRRALLQARLRACLFAVLLPALGGCGALYERLGGDFAGPPHEMDDHIGADAKNLVKAAFAFGAGAGQTVTLVDYHVHAIAARPPSRLHPDYVRGWGDPIRRFIVAPIFMSAAGVTDIKRIDAQYADRLLALLAHFQQVQRRYADGPVEARFYLYALDYYRHAAGQPRPACADLQEDPRATGEPVLGCTDLHVANAHVLAQARDFNAALAAARGAGKVVVVPVASVHPYRDDFVAAVRRFAQTGVRHLKWLPQTMNIDMALVAPSRYQALADAGVTLLVHTGDEHVFRFIKDKQPLGDPLLLRHALDQGVQVVALHSGREGRAPDGEHYFDRFLRLMQNPAYCGRLRGELSAVTIPDRPLTPGEGSLHLLAGLRDLARSAPACDGAPARDRLVNGSDYPLAALAYLNPSADLARMGVITPAERRALDEIYSYNPLLFDFVLKRKLLPELLP